MRATAAIVRQQTRREAYQPPACCFPKPNKPRPGFKTDCTEALLLVAEQRPSAFQGADSATIAEAGARLRAQAGGSLPWLDGGHKDPAHFHGRAFGGYNLWVARDELFGQYYKPGQQ
jgi:hypothetical protein